MHINMNLEGIRIVRTDAEIECPAIDTALRDAGAELILLQGGIDSSALGNALAQADLLLMCYTPITAELITGAKHLRGIVKYGVGIDAIDIDAATAAGIPVVNVPEYAEQTVAEGAFCLMLSLMKRLIPMHRTMQNQGWFDPTCSWSGHDIHNKCIAVIGTGRIGCAFARMAGQGFGANVIGYDPYVDSDTMATAGIRKVDDLHALLGEADVVSMHTVLTPSTTGMFGSAEFAAMKRKPVFINVSRGALVDEQALINSLDQGQISAAGLDVYCDEPLNRSTHHLATLFDRDNVILLPHVTFHTHEAMHRLSEDTLARCVEILNGERLTIRSSDPRLRAQSGVLDVTIVD
ncbi:MAG: 2-hydroxyacid dehydrogenase [Granulosicoccus sp.]